MATEEKYNLKRQNFVDKTKLYFDFLITELDFETPIHTFSEQSNSVITQDKFEFKNSIKHLKIVISNSYHPVDYGFEIVLTDQRTGTEKMIYNILKDKQDVKQSYLKKASKYLENTLKKD